MIILLIHYLSFNYYYFFSFRALDNQVCKKKRSCITVTSASTYFPPSFFGFSFSCMWQQYLLPEMRKQLTSLGVIALSSVHGNKQLCVCLVMPHL